MEGNIITLNRQVSHEYFIEERIEAGIVLEGGEVKSLRAGNVNLKDSFCLIINGELVLKNAHIAVYEKSGAFSTKNPRRDRKLLLHKEEITRLIGKVTRSGYTLVPIKLYFKQSLIKLELGLCKGKHLYDKKQSLKEKDIKREAEREIKQRV